jgi:hypothetical protein
MTNHAKNLPTRRKFITQWVPPVVMAVSLPLHAEISVSVLPRPIAYHASVSNKLCDDIAVPPTASFTLCNEETGSIVIETALVSLIGQPIKNAAVKVLSPTLPVKIAAGTCVDFMIENSGTPAFNCGDSLTLIGQHLNEHQEGFISFHL